MELSLTSFICNNYTSKFGQPEHSSSYAPHASGNNLHRKGVTLLRRTKFEIRDNEYVHASMLGTESLPSFVQS